MKLNRKPIWEKLVLIGINHVNQLSYNILLYHVYTTKITFKYCHRTFSLKINHFHHDEPVKSNYKFLDYQFFCLFRGRN